MLKFKISIAVVKIAWFPNFIVFFLLKLFYSRLSCMYVIKSTLYVNKPL